MTRKNVRRQRRRDARPSNHLVNAGTGTARRAESSITIELAYINPSTVNGTRRAVHPGSPRPDQMVGVLI
jgi:hypothetical protein